MNEPTMPTTIVIPHPIGSGPGVMARARKPMTRPMMRNRINPIRKSLRRWRRCQGPSRLRCNARSGVRLPRGRPEPTVDQAVERNRPRASNGDPGKQDNVCKLLEAEHAGNAVDLVALGGQDGNRHAEEQWER